MTIFSKLALYEGNGCGSAATGYSWSVVFTHREVCRARAINIQLCRNSQLTGHIELRQQRFCSMRDDFLLLYSPRCLKYVKTMHAWLCSDLACVYNSQSSCIVVEEVAPLCDTNPWQALLCKLIWQFSLSYIKHLCRQSYKPQFSYMPCFASSAVCKRQRKKPWDFLPCDLWHRHHVLSCLYV